MIRASVTVRTLLSEVYDQFYVPERLLESPQTTHEENRRAIRILSDYLGRPAEIDDLDKATLIACRAWRIEQGARKGKDGAKRKPLSPATANKDLRPLVALWNYCFDEELTTNAPRKIRPLKQARRKPEAYSIDGVSAVLASAMQETEQLAGVPASLWWCSLLAAFYDTGYRRKTLLMATWSDLDVERHCLRRPAEEQKDNEDQAQELHGDTLRLLESIRRPLRREIWPWPFRGHGPWYLRLRRILARSGLARVPKKPAHGLRASHATYLADVAGIQAAADSCAHSTTQVTREHYVDRTLLSSGRSASRLPRPAMPNLDRQRRLFE